MATGQQIVNWIKQFEGLRDNSGSKMWHLCGFPQFVNYAWCGATRLAAEKALGIDLSSFISPREELYVPDWVNGAREAKIWTPSVNSKVGWPVIFDWEGGEDGPASHADHVGTVVSNNPRLPYIYAIGGNTSDGVHMNLQRGVFIRRRYRTEIMGTVNIDKWLTSPKPPAKPKPVSNKLAEDGKFGTLSTKALGASDGEISSQPNDLKSNQSALLTATYAPLKKARGSKAIAKLQRKLGIKDDGYFGPGTIKALQRFLGFKGKDVDGYFGPKTAKATQHALNTGRL